MLAVTHHPEIAGKLQARWCGPAAMSAATGITAEECAAAINQSRGRPAYYQTQAIYPDMLRAVIRDLGFLVHHHRVTGSPTIKKFAQARPSKQFLTPIILWTRDHFVCLQGTQLADSHHEAGIPWRSYPRLRSKVIGYATIEVDHSSKTHGLAGWEPSDHGHYARKKTREQKKREAMSLARSLEVGVRDHGDELILDAPAGKMLPGSLHCESIFYDRGGKEEAWSDAIEILKNASSFGLEDCVVAECDCRVAS